MYMPLWFFLTLHMACLFWWLRSGQRLAWLCWIAAGPAAFGIHSPGLLLLAIQPVCLFTCRQLRGKTILLFGLGVLIMAIGPAGYYLGFNHWTRQCAAAALPPVCNPAPSLRRIGKPVA